jgi:hypothetical protein
VSTPLAPTTDTRLYLDAVAAALADLPARTVTTCWRTWPATSRPSRGRTATSR